jgi:hypothetical protein
LQAVVTAFQEMEGLSRADAETKFAAVWFTSNLAEVELE